MSFDIWSELFFWAVFVNLMLGVPLLIITFLLFRVYQLLMLQPTRDRAANRELVAFFVRLFVVFVGMWLPTAVLIWIFVWDGAVAYQWTGGSISHLQGLVSAVLYLRKKDIRHELALLGFPCLCGDVPTTAAGSAWASTSHARDKSASSQAGTEAAFSTSAAPAPTAAPAAGSSAASGSEASNRAGDVEAKDVEEAVASPWLASPPAQPLPHAVDSGEGSVGGGNERMLHRRASSSAAAIAETDKLLASLARAAEASIIDTQETPMVVIEWARWLAAGRLPRSSDGYTRPRTEGDVVVFISHRWWRPSELQPDDEAHTKYLLLTRGVRELVRRHRVDEGALVLWMDFTCVDQDDPSLQAKGINSLIAYAAMSSFVLVPVYPGKGDVKAFSRATHPGQLCNYGERAWCRLETYVFLCLAEVTARPLHCYGFGLCHGFFSPPLAAAERLRPLASTLDGPGASFTAAELPSSGELTNEADRATIGRIEEKVRETYVHAAILTARVRVEVSSRRRRTFVLSGKQVQDTDMPSLAEALLSTSVAPFLATLRLDGNLLTGTALAALGGSVICATHTPLLREVSLADNPRLLQAQGVVELAKWFANPLFALSTLRLAGCGIDGASGAELAGAIPQGTSLTHLDLRRNLLDDPAVEALLAACRPVQAGGSVDEQGLRVTLDIEGNAAVSAQAFQKVSVLCGVYA